MGEPSGRHCRDQGTRRGWRDLQREAVQECRETFQLEMYLEGLARLRRMSRILINEETERQSRRGMPKEAGLFPRGTKPETAPRAADGAGRAEQLLGPHAVDSRPRPVPCGSPAGTGPSPRCGHTRPRAAPHATGHPPSSARDWVPPTPAATRWRPKPGQRSGFAGRLRDIQPVTDSAQSGHFLCCRLNFSFINHTMEIHALHAEDLWL